MNACKILSLTGTVLAVLAGCSKVETADKTEYGHIELAVGVDGTKALLNNGNLGNNSQICLYDILDSSAGYYPHLNGLTASRYSGVWSIAGAPAEGYSWKHTDGKLYDHHFFCWLTQDENRLTSSGLFMNETVPVTPQITNDGHGVYTWSVSAIPMRFTYDQYDFCYSNIVTRTVEDPDYTTVRLQLKHLFAAMGIRFHNYDSAPITLDQVKIFGLTNVKSASIEFDTNDGSVTPAFRSDYEQSRNDLEHALPLMQAPITIGPDEELHNVVTSTYINGEVLSTDEERFFLMWPQTATELPGCTLAVYIHGNPEPYILSMKPQQAPSDYSWDAGTKHHVELAANGKSIGLKVTPLPWDKQTITLDDQEQILCNEAFRLKFDEMSCTIDDVNKRIYFLGGKPIKMSFKMEKPGNATWMIKMEGDIDAFEIDNAGPDGKTENYGDKVSTPTGTIDGTTAYVTIFPMNLNPDQDYQIQVSIVVRTSTGRLIVDDSVLGKYKDYVIIQQAS